MTNFTFNSRETYLVYKQEWNLRYCEHSTMLRTLKHTIRENMRNGKPAYKQQRDYMIGVIKAHQLLLERESSKIEAGRQWLEARQVESR